MSPASSPSATAPEAVTEPVFAALDPKCFPVDQRFGKLFSRLIVNSLNRCAGNVHLAGALLLSEPFQVDEPDGFVLVNRQVN